MATDIEKKDELLEEENGSAFVNTAENVDAALAKSEAFIENNQKKLLTAILVVILAAVGVIFYVRNVYQPRIISANEEISKAQQYFMMDSFQVALDGKDDVSGFLSIIADYSGTPAANLAGAYAGLCYKRLGDNEEALKYLTKFSADDKIVDPAINGAIGDCYLDNNDLDKAKSYYRKAINSKNSLIAPIYIERLALVIANEGDVNEAINLWKSVKSDYPASDQAREADKMIGFLEAK